MGYALIDGRRELVLIDSGARANSVTPEYATKHQLVVAPVHELADNPKSLAVVGVGGVTTALGYVIINVKIEEIPSYAEDQVALVVPDVSGLGQEVPVILGTPTIHRLTRCMKESEISDAPPEWKMAIASYEASLAMKAFTAEPGTKFPTNTGQDPLDLNETVILKGKYTIPAFSSIIAHGQTKKTFMIGHRLNVMVQPPYFEDEANLPVGLYVQRVYTELRDGSRNVSFVLRNGTSKPIQLSGGRVIARIATANAVPEAEASPALQEKLFKKKIAALSTVERQKLLLEVLEKNGSLGKLSSWDPQTAEKAKRLLIEFHHIFSLEPNENGCTEATKHAIEILPDRGEPFKERFRRIAPHLVEEVRQHIQEMLDGGTIVPSQSPWCNAVVLARKKDGTLRFCIDFRRLNDRTRKDSYPLPRTSETMESLVGARIFSCMDLKSGFWQVKMAEDSRQYTAFTVGSMGVYEFLRMPYGLCNAPATFQRLMQNCLGELNLTFALIYLDDVIVHSKSPEEHLCRLQAVFDRFAEHGLKLKPSKCHFFKESITYLGHEISKNGMLPGSDGIRAIAEMAPPATFTGIRRFLGASGYFRRFIKNYARIAKPLNDLLGCENSKLKLQPVTLGPEALEAFGKLKLKCITAPVLAFADFNQPFLLETDASGDGLGAVLSQKLEDNKFHPVAYASRGLKGSESNYHSSKLEFLALKWAVTDQFKEYLQYRPFTVKTDNNPLTYILTTPNLDATGHRWVAALAQFDMKIEYLRGADNKVADALSRVESRLDEATVKELMENARHADSPRAEADHPNLIARHEEIDKQTRVTMKALLRAGQIKENLADENWVRLQEKDAIIRHVIAWKRRDKDKDKSTLHEYLTGKVPSFEAAVYGKRENSFVLFRNLLYTRDTPKNSNEKVLLFVVPVSKRQAAIDLCHRDTGHQGRDRSLSLLCERFWWPKMRTSLVSSLKACKRCRMYEGKNPIPPLVNISSASQPMDLVHVDLVNIDVTVSTSRRPVVQKLLVVVDHFTRYVQAYRIADKTALSTAKCLYDNYFRHFGFPQCLMSDQGKEFCNGIIESLCIYLGIKKIRTTAYHPQSNGAVERSHQTLQRMLGKLEGTQRKHWPEYLASVTLAYNATRSQVTGYSPYFLMFGRRPRLPVDLQFPTLRELPEPQGVHDYVNALYGRLREAIKLARDSAAEDAARHKRLYDRRAGTVQLHPGDKVLVRLDAYRGQRRKLVNRWGADLHTVVKRMAEDFPTYAVRNDRTKKETVLHRARLLLWAAVEESGNGVHLTAAQLGIRIARLDPSHKPDGGEVMQVPHEWTIVGFGLNLVKSKPSNEDSEPETGPLALATSAETLPNEEADRRMESGEETISTASDTDAGSEDALSP